MRTALFCLVVIVTTGCDRSYSPAKPTGVPQKALWAGGVDGGGWVTCSADRDQDLNLCTIYEEGRTSGPSRYKLKGENRAARSDELIYTYVTGKAIGLRGGKELLQTAPAEPENR